MQGSFAIGLLEILAYLTPGLLIEAVYIYVVLDLTKVPESPVWLTVMVIAGYVIGHALTIVSLLLVRFRRLVKRIRKEKTREEQYTFYLSLREHLQRTFGQNTSYQDEYFFSRRLVMEHCPTSASTIDRLTALALFSRNTCMGCLLCSPIIFSKNIPLALLLIVLSVLLFLRYMQFERGMEGTAFRVAYMYFVEKTSKSN